MQNIYFFNLVAFLMNDVIIVKNPFLKFLIKNTFSNFYFFN